MLIGLALKSGLILAWRFFQLPWLLGPLTTYDPGAAFLAATGTHYVFGSRGIAPSPAEAVLFEVLLVTGFSLECFVAGLLVQWLMMHKHASAQANGTPAGGTKR